MTNEELAMPITEAPQNPKTPKPQNPLHKIFKFELLNKYQLKFLKFISYNSVIISPKNGRLSGSSSQHFLISSKKGPGHSLSLIFGLNPSLTTR